MRRATGIVVTLMAVALMSAAPAHAATRLPRLSISSAHRALSAALGHRFNGTFRHRDYHRFAFHCRHHGRTRVRCRDVSWAIGDTSFYGHATVRYRRRHGRVQLRSAWRLHRLNEYCAQVRHRNRCIRRVKGGYTQNIDPKPPPSAPLPGQSRTVPVPYGQPHDDGPWQIQVLGTAPHATAGVLSFNEFNDPPAPGRQFYLVRVRATYTSGSGSESFDADRLDAIGASAVQYDPDINDCGVIPDSVPDNTLYPGGSVEGNVCWQIKSADAPSLEMVDTGEEAAYPEPPPVFFALAP
jgi:hypothetical protein